MGSFVSPGCSSEGLANLAKYPLYIRFLGYTMSVLSHKDPK